MIRQKDGAVSRLRRLCILPGRIAVRFCREVLQRPAFCIQHQMTSSAVKPPREFSPVWMQI